MGTIYRSTDLVRVWPGEAADRSDALFDLSRGIAEKNNLQDAPAAFNSWRASLKPWRTC